MDWNNDGRKDLITGEYDGYVRIYLNTGTDADPAFSGYTNLKVAGSDFDCGDFSQPEIVDWNNDGKKDVLCGETGGYVYLLLNSGTDAAPQFSMSTLIEDGAGYLSVAGVSSPVVADWNRDGKKDLIVGQTEGRLLYFENVGTDASPAFNGSEPLYAGEFTLDIGWYSRPEVADWDNDGITDIICGSDEGLWEGHVRYFHATDDPILHHFEWSTVPSPQYAGTPFSVTVTAKDIGGGRVTDFTDSVALTGHIAPDATIGSGTSSWSSPMNTVWHDARTQVIYLASELGGPFTMRGLALDVTTLPGQTMNNWTIRMKHTGMSNYLVWETWEDGGWTTVYQNNETVSSTGWAAFAFSTPFEYNGTDNLMIDFSYNNSAWSSDGQCRYTPTEEPRTLYFYTDGGFGDPLSWSSIGWPFPSPSNYVPNVQLFSSTPVPLTISPTTSGNFVNGVWTGSVTVSEEVDAMYLRADDGRGHIGESDTFAVGEPGGPPVADFSADPISGSRPLEVEFTDESRGTVTSWSWDFGDGHTSTEQNPSHTYYLAGDHTVTLTVSGPGGPDDSATAVIHVLPGLPSGGSSYKTIIDDIKVTYSKGGCLAWHNALDDTLRIEIWEDDGALILSCREDAPMYWGPRCDVYIYAPDASINSINLKGRPETQLYVCGEVGYVRNFKLKYGNVGDTLSYGPDIGLGSAALDPPKKILIKAGWSTAAVLGVGYPELLSNEAEAEGEVGTVELKPKPFEALLDEDDELEEEAISEASSADTKAAYSFEDGDIKVIYSEPGCNAYYDAVDNLLTIEVSESDGNLTVKCGEDAYLEYGDHCDIYIDAPTASINTINLKGRPETQLSVCGQVSYVKNFKLKYGCVGDTGYFGPDYGLGSSSPEPPNKILIKWGWTTAPLLGVSY